MNIILQLWPILLLVIIVWGAVLFLKLKSDGKTNEKADLSVYERKPYLFDTNSEFNLYKVLVELYGDKYYIFPQINYSHIIRPRKTTWEDERKYRSRIDRKSADFIFCDMERVVPKLIIELDGGVHNFRSKRARDEFINELTRIVDLPILHLKTDNLNKEYIRGEISRKLGLNNN